MNKGHGMGMYIIAFDGSSSVMFILHIVEVSLDFMCEEYEKMVG